MVAPSFQSMTVVSEVYTKDKKEYIDVRNEKTGTVRHVRWYSEHEYAKLYGKTAAKAAMPKVPVKFYMPPEVTSLSVTKEGNTKTIHGTVAAPRALIPCLLWQAYGAYMQKGE